MKDAKRVTSLLRGEKGNLKHGFLWNLTHIRELKGRLEKDAGGGWLDKDE